MPLSRRQDLLRALPYARRYARALSGSQSRGDLLVAESLRELIAVDDPAMRPRLRLYQWISRHYTSSTTPPASGDLTVLDRQLLLLTALEELSLADAARVLGLDEATARTTLEHAYAGLRSCAQTNVLIIEDEPIIAMDIEELVHKCGHRIAGVAATEKEAIEIATRTRPGLILADINLGAGGDGMTAVSQILQQQNIPVIFVTAYPERLLTGERIEPAFVITKPFEPLTLAIATYQAVSGGLPLG
ncbi:response regulator [Gluconacetobacter entanii]|uniref:response regulator n=1 Tax=Gluconacetobacter entanii TaxID=108528 RepID=UPI001C934DC6|nr:response regulator [Gluconacetobacter entanii]MBY4640261.1 response regulator [Gluconacetobacter entanii]MCW4582208.1 response regulator [Gluconacetobacter entanii]MCW4585433.1 response regulator [Gluconacetobacter entanii]MCW4588606.1 response regulator [Gluconacetobacter entanii]